MKVAGASRLDANSKRSSKYKEPSTKFCTKFPAMSTTRVNAYVGLGSNLGDRAGNLLLGIRGMMNAGIAVMRISHIYETEPVETFPQPAFLNMVAELQVDGLLPPEELMSTLLQIETTLGRIRNSEKGPRNIDLDLLLFGEQICDTDLLTLPHPRLAHRRFVLAPLVELAPALVHPTFHKTMSKLLEMVADNSAVRRWDSAAPG